MTMLMTDAAREARARRALTRQGLALQKSRARDGLNPTFGTYAIVDPFLNTLVAGDPNTGFGLSLDDVEAAVRE